MAGIALDRCLSITKWNSWYLTYSSAILLVSGVWVFSLLLVSPPLYGWSSFVLEGIQTSCSFNYLSLEPEDIGFTLLLFFVGFIFPVFVIIASYSLIIRHILRHHRMMALFHQTDHHMTTTLSNNATGYSGTRPLTVSLRGKNVSPLKPKLRKPTSLTHFDDLLSNP